MKDLWDESVASSLGEPEKLRYRSNLLGADLRIINFGGGNTSSKVKQQDPVGAPEVVLWVKGSGGGLGSEASTDELRNKLAQFYAQRMLTREPIDQLDCAEAILFLASDRSRCTTGHLFPVDGGLTEAFLR